MELRECPFCGGVPEGGYDVDGYVEIVCIEPQGCGCTLGGFDNESRATIAWNARAGEREPTGDDKIISEYPTEVYEAALKYCVDLESGTETVWPGDSAFYLMGALLRREIERRSA